MPSKKKVGAVACAEKPDPATTLDEVLASQRPAYIDGPPVDENGGENGRGPITAKVQRADATEGDLAALRFTRQNLAI